MNFENIDSQLDQLASQIVDSAYKVHKAFGPGLLENAYETCLIHELIKITGHRLGLLINFNVPLIKDGIKRIIL